MNLKQPVPFLIICMSSIPQIVFSAEDVSYVFDHFYRGDKSRDRKSGGLGLGLAIVKQLVEIHRGQVTVKSEMGKGSIFEVILPLDKVDGHSV